MPWPHMPIYFPNSADQSGRGDITARVINYSDHTITVGTAPVFYYSTAWTSSPDSVPSMIPVIQYGELSTGRSPVPVGVAIADIAPMATGRLAVRGMVSKLAVTGTPFGNVSQGDWIRMRTDSTISRLGYSGLSTYYDRQNFAVAMEDAGTSTLALIRAYVVQWRS